MKKLNYSVLGGSTSFPPVLNMFFPLQLGITEIFNNSITLQNAPILEYNARKENIFLFWIVREN